MEEIQYEDEFVNIKRPMDIEAVVIDLVRRVNVLENSKKTHSKKKKY